MKTENEDLKILKIADEFYFRQIEETKELLQIIEKCTSSKIREKVFFQLSIMNEENEKIRNGNKQILKKLEGVPVFDCLAIEELEKVFLKHGILDPRGDVCKKIIDELRSMRKPS